MITRLAVEHYKSIEKADLRLKELSILVGPNGSGKSNVIDAARFIRDSIVNGLDRSVAERHGIDSIRQWSPSRPYEIVVRVEISTGLGKGYLSFTLASKRGTHIVKREEGFWQSSTPRKRPPMKYARKAAGSVEIKIGKEPPRILMVEQQEELFLSQFGALHFRPLAHAIGNMEAYSIYPNVFRTPQKPSSDLRLYGGGENLASVYKQLAASKRQAHVRARSEILSSMKLVMPSLDSIRIQSIGGLMVPLFRVKEATGKVHDFNVSQVSDGTLRVLGLLTALYQPYVPNTIALEEPEQTINPGVLSLIAEAIVETSASTQLIVATHSPDFLDKFDDPTAVLSVNMIDGVTHIGAISPSQLQAVRDRLFSLGELMTIEGLHS